MCWSRQRVRGRAARGREDIGGSTAVVRDDRLDAPGHAASTHRPRAATAVEIAHLRKTYGPSTAVDDASFSVAEGEIFGLLGPNGAGKTTAVECAIGLREPDAGTIRLLGLDPRADRAQVHQIVGVQLQASALPAKLRHYHPAMCARAADRLAVSFGLRTEE